MKLLVTLTNLTELLGNSGHTHMKYIAKKVIARSADLFFPCARRPQVASMGFLKQLSVACCKIFLSDWYFQGLQKTHQNWCLLSHSSFAPSDFLSKKAINRLCANNNTVVLSQIFLFIIQDFATTCVTLLRLCVLNDLSFYNPCLSLFLLPDLLMASVHWVLIPYLASAFHSTHRFVVLSSEWVWHCLDSVGNAFTNEAFSNQE